ncbi:hypothetical protein HYU17_00450 [Candidatus Woesearchaeota archaeon]|nr:hypothetical protein [Candidatus Woesearchaeota archaeon]
MIPLMLRLGKDVIAAFKERIDVKKLRQYLEKHSATVRKRAISHLA